MCNSEMWELTTRSWELKGYLIRNWYSTKQNNDKYNDVNLLWESLILLDFVCWSFKVFKGNKDRDSIVYHEINPPIQARYIRLRPTAWYHHISLRMELYGCLGMVTVTLCHKSTLAYAWSTSSSMYIVNWQTVLLTHKHYLGIATGC